MEHWPLVLAGPILRHVAPDQVSVWVALSEPRSVHLSLYAGDQFADDLPAPIASSHVDTLRIGPMLHVAVVTARPSLPLDHGAKYSYDLGFGDPGSSGYDTHLQSEGLLSDDLAAPKRKLALGYATNQLPSFVTPPASLNDLRLVHGSCRKTHGGGADGLAWLDYLIQQPETRPHQLFLTGDQIYADEIPVCVLDVLIPIGEKLVGGVEKVPIDGQPYDFTAANFPPGFRQDLMVQKAKFSTSEGHSHLVTFGEFAAMYLLSWSNVLWPESSDQNIFGALRTFSAINLEVDRDVSTWPLFFNTGNDSAMAGILHDFLRGLTKAEFELMARKDEAAEAEFKSFKSGRPVSTAAELDRLMGLFRSQYGKWLKKDAKVRESVSVFYMRLAEVRRALANVPVYMIMDDHETTDDWNVTAEWQQRVTSSTLGRTILRNGLASYVVFQAWGNKPDYWNDTSPAGGRAAIDHIAGLFANLAAMPDTQHAGALDTLFGIQPADHVCKLKFYFNVSGPAHQVFALDTRTARHFDSRLSSPALLSDAALAAQLPSTPPNKEIALVIAPSPVLSPAVIEEMVWPALMRAWDTIHAIKSGNHLGYVEWDSEAWAFNPVGFEKLIKKLAGWGKAVILSGDVHYAISAEMDYFRKGVAQPARIAQFTSSGLKNSFPDFAVSLIRGLSFAQQLLRFGARMQRLAWEDPAGDPLNIPLAQGTEVLNPHLRNKLNQRPVLIPTHGWPKDTTINVAPDWSWRFDLVYDLRPDAERPEDAQPPPDPDIDFNLQGYFQAALRHIEAMDRNTNKRSIHFDSNLGLIRFTGSGASLSAVQELYSVPLEDIDQVPQVYAEHVVAMAADSEPPTIEYVDVDHLHP